MAKHNQHMVLLNKIEQVENNMEENFSDIQKKRTKGTIIQINEHQWVI